MTHKHTAFRHTQKIPRTLWSWKGSSPLPPKGELVCRSAHFVFSIAACTLPVGMWQSLIPWLKPPKTGSSEKQTHLISSQRLCLFASTNVARTHLHWPVELLLPCIKGSGRREDASLLSCAFKMLSFIQLKSSFNATSPAAIPWRINWTVLYKTHYTSKCAHPSAILNPALSSQLSLTIFKSISLSFPTKSQLKMWKKAAHSVLVHTHKHWSRSKDWSNAFYKLKPDLCLFTNTKDCLCMSEVFCLFEISVWSLTQTPSVSHPRLQDLIFTCFL